MDYLRNNQQKYGCKVFTLRQLPMLGGRTQSFERIGFIFQKDNVDDWEPCPQYKAALGKCPELVTVENCLSWSPMSEVLNILPGVVHPIDVQTNSVYVNGRNWRYLCGVTAI
jgi:hypothetical protein